MRSRSLVLAAAAACLAACEPALNWRSVRPEGVPLAAMFPCRPASHARDVALPGTTVRMMMLACTADGATYALAFADVVDPSQVTPALATLREAAIANVGGVVERDAGLMVAGMTANAQARRVTVAGRLPGGKPARLTAAFFAKGTIVYQATAVGEALEDEAAETFMAGLRFSR